MVNINLISGIVHLHGIYIRTSRIQQIMNFSHSVAFPSARQQGAPEAGASLSKALP